MGVYRSVAICVKHSAPLDSVARARIVELCLEHELLAGECSLGIPDASFRPIAPPQSLWTKVKALFGAAPPAAPPDATTPLVRAGLRPYGGACPEGQGVALVQKSAPGAWLVAGARAHHTAFVAIASAPRWKGEPQDGGFAYLASDAAFDVRTGSGDEGLVGPFFDALSIDAKRVPDGRAMASSPFVRALKEALGVSVTCRSMER